MPLLNHFHERRDPRANWQSFHNRWANAIADSLDRMLPRRFFALVEINLGRAVEADIGEFESSVQLETNGSGGGVAVQTYAPPAVGLVLPAVYLDEIEVQIRDVERERHLVAAIELVSPSNKDRPETRRAFAVKIAAYMQVGVGVVVADLVLNAHFNLHNELVELLRLGPTFAIADATRPYAVAYRPTHRQERNEIDVWPHLLTVGEALPTLPLALRGHGCVPLDLEATYMDTCRRSRLV